MALATETSEDTQQCIEDCQRCHNECLEMALGFSLDLEDPEASGALLRLLINCAEICQTTANFMLSGSPVHGVVCEACAEVCDACAIACEEWGGMEACAESCRLCADSCREMALDDVS